MEERTLHIVIVGHVDHGKSTLIGRLFYDTGCLPPDKLEEIKRTSESLGKELEFAYIMDHLEEERNRGITIDIAHTFFKTDKRRYVIIDAPGHKEFLKNMISGSSQAEAALLLIDASEGVREQTMRHCYILGLLGIGQVAVLINKMDMVGYSREVFEDVRTQIEEVLGRLDISASYILPISARLGENVAKRSEKLDWYDGPTVLEALDSFHPLKVEDKDLRFPVQDVYQIDGRTITVGRVEAGTLSAGQEVVVFPGGMKARVKEIKKFMEDDIKEAPVGDCVGVVLEGCEPKRGQVLTRSVAPTVTDTLRANIFWIVEKRYDLGIPLTLRCATQAAGGRIEKIFRRFDPATIEVVEKDAKHISPAEVAEVEIKLKDPIAVDRFTDIPEMGRFVLEHAGHPVAGGIII